MLSPFVRPAVTRSRLAPAQPPRLGYGCPPTPWVRSSGYGVAEWASRYLLEVHGAAERHRRLEASAPPQSSSGSTTDWPMVHEFVDVATDTIVAFTRFVGP